MGKAIPIVGIVGAALAALTATIFVDIMPAVVGLLAIAGGIFVAISKDWRRLVPGISAALLAILGILGVIGSVGGKDAGVDFPISVPVGTALIVAACLGLSGASALFTLDREPKWMSYTWLGVWGLGFILAFVFAGQLGDQSTAGSFVVAAFALATLGGPIQLLRAGE